MRINPMVLSPYFTTLTLVSFGGGLWTLDRQSLVLTNSGGGVGGGVAEGFSVNCEGCSKRTEYFDALEKLRVKSAGGSTRDCEEQQNLITEPLPAIVHEATLAPMNQGDGVSQQTDLHQTAPQIFPRARTDGPDRGTAHCQTRPHIPR